MRYALSICHKKVPCATSIILNFRHPDVYVLRLTLSELGENSHIYMYILNQQRALDTPKPRC